MLEETQEFESLATAYNSLGGIYYNTFNFDRTILFTQKANDIAKRYDLNQHLGLFHNNLSGAYRQQKRYGLALSHAFKALEISTTF
jgi:tetratricopeptide (TPR) repeat protein